jgi:hypothetical protein
MIIYEIVTIATAVIASAMFGAFAVIAIALKDARTQMTVDRVALKDRVTEFGEITKQASAANLSLGEKIIALENQVMDISERLAMYQGTATIGKGAGTWQPNPQRKAP